MAPESGRAGVAVGGRRWLLLSVAAAAGALLIGKLAAHLYADYLWYSALGAADVWRARYGALLLLRAGAAAAATLFVFANLYAVRQSVVSLVLPRRVGNLDIGEEVERKHLTWTAAALSVLIGVALAWAWDDWSGLLMVRHGLPFGESDPYFATDLAFYVYWLPFEMQLFRWALTMVLLVIGLVVLLYALTPSLRWESGSLYISGYVRRHLAMLAGVLLVVLAWHHRLDMFAVLGHGSGPEGAFGYLDHRVRIPADLILSLITFGAGLTVLWSGWTGQMRLAFAAITGVLVATLGARLVAPFIVERAIGDRDPVARERPYQATRAGYTRRAFAVDRIQVVDSAFGFLSLRDAAPFVPVFDEGVLPTSVEPAPGSDFAWTVSDTGVLVSAVNVGGSPVRVLPAGVGTAGLPLRVPLEEPRVSLLVVPDSTARPRIVSDSAKVIAAPALNSRLARFAHALSMQDFRVWLGALPAPNPRAVARRTVRERVAALAPVFMQGASISPVWSAGDLFWAVDLYSVSSTYPLSKRIISGGAERSYLQHAATALVNTTTGRVTLLADSAPDPVAATWQQRFPRLFSRHAAITPAVRRQLQPAREGARAQAAAFARYGTRGANSERGNRLPDQEGPDSALALTDQPLLGLPALDAVGYLQPVLDRGDRILGVFVATGGTARRAMWWPLRAPGPVWHEALDRLQATDTLDRPQMVRGYVRPVPLGGSVALVQPRYDWNEGDRPRLLRLSILEGDSVRTAPLLVDSAARPVAARPAAPADFRERVALLYEEMRRAMARGDWAAYGRAFNELGTLIARSRE